MVSCVWEYGTVRMDYAHEMIERNILNVLSLFHNFFISTWPFYDGIWSNHALVSGLDNICKNNDGHEIREIDLWKEIPVFSCGYSNVSWELAFVHLTEGISIELS